jgi:hypothetical protein
VGTLAKTDDDSLTYPGILPDVDLSYDLTNVGFEETMTLASVEGSKVPLAFHVSATDLSFRLEDTGAVSILVGDEVVGIIPPPSAVDSSIDPETGLPAEGKATYSLTDLGAGPYLLTVWPSRSHRSRCADRSRRRRAWWPTRRTGTAGSDRPPRNARPLASPRTHRPHSAR